MGYDMRWCTKDPGEEAAVDAARKTFDLAAQRRNALPDEEKGQWNRAKADALGDWDSQDAYDGRSDRYRAAQDRVHAAYEAYLEADRSYFRLNGFGMGRYCDLMQHIGMAFEDEPCPEFPKAEEFGVTDEECWALDDPEGYPEVTFTDERLAQVLKYRAATDAVLDFHGKTDTPGIPLHKFSTNDGWHVLPAEATAAVRIWQKFVDGNGQDDALHLVENSLGDTAYWLKWVKWVAESASHGGFEVH